MPASAPTHVALLVDPRFPGGTAAAVAREVAALHPRVRLAVHALPTRMFDGRPVNPVLQAALDAAGLPLRTDPVVRAEVVVLHNPAALKFDTVCPLRILCDRLVVVTHENLLRPDGAEGFDVAHTLALIDRAAIARARRLAPVSAWNRARTDAWLAGRRSGWRQAPFDWPNICDFALRPPPAAPRDRRGRHSRPGLEKFPPPDRMRAHFPAHAECNRILGADALMLDRPPPHWDCLPFGAEPVDDFLASIDVVVYFTHPLLRESFGRVIAEAIAAGKLVVTDPGTAATFGPGVLASDGNDVDDLVAAHLADPAAFAARVGRAQADLARFTPDRFAAGVLAGLHDLEVTDDALL